MNRHRPKAILRHAARILACLVVTAAGGASRAGEPPATTPAVQPAPAAQSAPGPAPVSRAEAFAEFRRLFDARQYREALGPAQQVVELTDPGTRTGQEELQVALMNLAVTQHRAEDYLGAEASYLRVIGLVESGGRRVSARLARAQAGLALAYHAAQRHDLAAERFAQAIALSRRTEGLFNEDQLPLLESQAESLGALDRMDEALQARRYALRVVERRHGADSLRYARELESLGRWYARAGAYDASRSALRRAIDIVEQAEGKDSRSLVGPLTTLAECTRRRLLDPAERDAASADEQRRLMFQDQALPPGLSQSSLLTEGQQALERAAAIAARADDPSPAQVADTQTLLGDWLLWRDREEAALAHYRQAWHAAAGAEVDGKPLREALFGQPVLVDCDRPDAWDRYRRRPPSEVELRSVEVELTVDARGRTREPRVLADAGDPKLVEQALRAAASARYRPRFENGEPAEATGVRFVQPFYVLVGAAPPAG